MNKDKKLVDYLQMIENNQPSGIVSGAFIEEQPNLLHKITGGVYKSFSSNGIEYDDVFQECCLAVLQYSMTMLHIQKEKIFRTRVIMFTLLSSIV